MNCIYCNQLKEEHDEFCGNCGAKFPKSFREELVTEYFRKGFKYQEILDLLYVKHGIKMSLRTLKSNLKQYGLRRKNLNVNIEYVGRMVEEQIGGSSNRYGYRTMWQHLKQNHCVHASRDTIMHLMREIDPEGVTSRKSRKLKRRRYQSLGPNDCWHADGYDKLKPFGFPIHGCIDGFSRKILWLELVKSNNNPSTIASLFIKSVEELEILPKRLRTDCGTENCEMAAIQSFLRRNHNDEYAGSKAHLYGSSHSNQRIEAWWSAFRRTKSGYIIDFFKDIVHNGSYDPDDELQKACAWFCFAPLIRKELYQCKELWNSHYIRKSEYCENRGRPDYLYFFPQHGFCNQGMQYSNLDMIHMKDQLSDDLESGEDELDEIYTEYFSLLLNQLNLEKPSCFASAFQVFTTLKDYLR